MREMRRRLKTGLEKNPFRRLSRIELNRGLVRRFELE